MKTLNDFEKQMLIYRINNLVNLGNKDFMVSFASIVNDYDLLQKDDYANLQNHDWCRDNFKHEYTVIKSLSKNVADALVNDKKDNTGRQRYYDNVFYLGGSNYLLSSEWYNGKGKKQDNKTAFVDWLKGIVNERFQINKVHSLVKNGHLNDTYRPYITAIKSKPFLLLAGISGTGKSRIVRELARACWEEGSEEYKAQKPKNFEMIQVKPNWHDSSELIGYVSRIDGEKFVVGPFLKFIAKAIQNPDVPYFLCLDEMNLASVEQYFAEYLSVIESRKWDNGEIVTDPIIDYEPTDAYKSLIDQLFYDDETRKKYLTKENGERLGIPQNLIVVGTVNMDETTFSFSRKVLDRAMTIEMNEVDLEGGLDKKYESIGKLGAAELIGNAVEGVDVYADNKGVCDRVINYLKAINGELEGTPFKVAYRTRNEFLLYVVNNLPYNKDENGEDIALEVVMARALDEITSMKILSRIEGDTEKIDDLLDRLKEVIKKQLNEISSGKEYSGTKDKEGTEYSVSLAKLKEMKLRLKSGYTSFWS